MDSSPFGPTPAELRPPVGSGVPLWIYLVLSLIFHALLGLAWPPYLNPPAPPVQWVDLSTFPPSPPPPPATAEASAPELKKSHQPEGPPHQDQANTPDNRIPSASEGARAPLTPPQVSEGDLDLPSIPLPGSTPQNSRVPSGTPDPSLSGGVGPSQRVRFQDLLGTGSGGVVTGEALKERVQNLATLDAQNIQARARVDRGIAPPYTSDIQKSVQQKWTVTLGDVQRMGVRPQTRFEHFVPEHKIQVNLGGIPTACSYAYYYLGTVALRLDRSGHIVAMDLIDSSGRPNLDQDLRQMVEQAAPFGEVPADTIKSSGTFEGTWELGLRDYQVSNCKFPGMEDKVIEVMRFLGEMY